MRFSLPLALALASSGVIAASAADLRILSPKRRPPVSMECTNNGKELDVCAPAPHKVGSPIGKGALQ